MFCLILVFNFTFLGYVKKKMTNSSNRAPWNALRQSSLYEGTYHDVHYLLSRKSRNYSLSEIWSNFPYCKPAMHLVLLMQGRCIRMVQSVLTPRQETTFSTPQILRTLPWGTGDFLHDAANRTIRFCSPKMAYALNHALCPDNVAASRVAMTGEIVCCGHRRYFLMKFQYQQFLMAIPLPL